MSIKKDIAIFTRQTEYISNISLQLSSLKKPYKSMGCFAMLIAKKETENA